MYFLSNNWKGTLKYDGGALMDQGVHGIDLLEYSMGDIKDVQGKIATLPIISKWKALRLLAR